MKKSLLFVATISLIFSSVALISSTKDEKDDLIRYNGAYSGKTMEVQVMDQVVETYNTLRFYRNGTVIGISGNGKDVITETLLYNRDDGTKYDRKGTYKIEGKEISFSMNNEGTEDYKLEGLKEDHYKGTIIGPDQMQLKISFSSGSEVETTFKYSAWQTE